MNEPRSAVVVRMDLATREKLQQQAALNARSLSAEAMLIIRAGLESKQQEPRP